VPFDIAAVAVSCEEAPRVGAAPETVTDKTLTAGLAGGEGALGCVELPEQPTAAIVAAKDTDLQKHDTRMAVSVSIADEVKVLTGVRPIGKCNDPTHCASIRQ